MEACQILQVVRGASGEDFDCMFLFLGFRLIEIQIRLETGFGTLYTS